MKYEKHQSSSELLQSVEGSLRHGGVQGCQDRLVRGLQEHHRVLQSPSKNDEAEFSSPKPSQSGILLTFGKSLLGWWRTDKCETVEAEGDCR